jgi:hypothetical protein
LITPGAGQHGSKQIEGLRVPGGWLACCWLPGLEGGFRVPTLHLPPSIIRRCALARLWLPGLMQSIQDPTPLIPQHSRCRETLYALLQLRPGPHSSSRSSAPFSRATFFLAGPTTPRLRLSHFPVLLTSDPAQRHHPDRTWPTDPLVTTLTPAHLLPHYLRDTAHRCSFSSGSSFCV